jgi:uncharacterized membrane protein HdeD (DUF308 family)
MVWASALFLPMKPGSPTMSTMSTRSRLLLVVVGVLAVLVGLGLLVAPGASAGIGVVLAATVFYALAGVAAKPPVRARR